MTAAHPFALYLYQPFCVPSVNENNSLKIIVLPIATEKGTYVIYKLPGIRGEYW